MRKSIRLALLAALVLTPAVALAAGSGQTDVVGNCFKEEYKPVAIVITCGDANASVLNLKWTSWTTTKATGNGTYEVNSCNPNCAAGNVKKYSVGVTLIKPTSCTGQKYRVFKQMGFVYASNSAVGKNPTHFKLFCPEKAPTTQ